MPGDREMLLARGLDGYLAKPVRKNDLLREIRRLLPELLSGPAESSGARSTDGRPLTPAQHAGVTATSLLDRQELLVRCGDDEAMVAQVLSLVRENGPVLLERCRSALGAGDTAELRARAHEFAGMIANVSKAVAAEARSLQKLATDGNRSDAEDALRRLERLMRELSSEF
jgi:HPt (histidine-containing phosphotransfer) domain-containing protein